MERQKKESRLYSRRSILTGSALLLGAGIAGRITNAYGEPKPAADTAPPLPWKWPKLDPLEAGRRSYRSYLEKKG